MSRTHFAVSARAWSVAALPALLIVADGTATRRIARSENGLRYSFANTSSTTTADGKTRERVIAAGTGTVLGSNARIDLADAASNFVLKKGSYMLLKGESGTITIVDPSARTYSEMSAAELGQSIAAIAGAATSLVRMQVSGVETRGETVGAGPAVSGFPTTQYRISQRYTLTVSVFGKKSTMTSQSTIDYFVASSLTEELVSPFTDLGAAAGQMVPSGGGLGELAQQVASEQRKLFTGPALRILTRTTSADEKGRESVSTGVNEITRIERAAVDPSAFEIPAGFKAVSGPVSAMGGAGTPTKAASDGEAASQPRDSAGLPGQLGSAAKEGASEGAKTSVRDGARDAVAKKVRGMFRRP